MSRVNSLVPCAPLLIVGLKINGQMTRTVDGYSVVHSAPLQCVDRKACSVHTLQYIATGHCYSISILAVHFQSNGPDRKAPNCSPVTCPWHVTGSQSLSSPPGTPPLFRPLALRQAHVCSGRSLPPPATAARSGRTFYSGRAHCLN
jgi:hypothetical protein